ncbi:MAG: hypothetical protein HY960_11090 [Ignavibacteriae bacterium]|nr:hypothetical protein [Ignavibacteriota bacterium]
MLAMNWESTEAIHRKAGWAMRRCFPSPGIETKWGLVLDIDLELDLYCPGAKGMMEVFVFYGICLIDIHCQW